MFFSHTDNHIHVAIYVKPYAKKTKIVTISDDELHIALHAKPKDGEANEALILWLSEWLHVPKTHIQCKQGQQNRHKIVSLPYHASILEKLSQFLLSSK